MAEVVVVADDLTGSNATGALFARRGLRAVTVSSLAHAVRYAPEVDVLVVNTESRHAEPGVARDLVAGVVGTVGDARLVVKRVDTTLRGNVASEVDAALTALETLRPASRVRALLVPAYPDAGRTTVGGIHLVDGTPMADTDAARDPLNPVRSSRVARVVEAVAGRAVGELRLDVIEHGAAAVASALEAPTDIVVCDATTSMDLRVIASGAARVAAERGVYWLSVDSGPFGVALAAAMGIGSPAEAPAPVLAVVGSITTQTLEQIAATERDLGARYVEVGPDGLDVDAIVAELEVLLRSAPSVVGVRMRPVPAGAAIDPSAAGRIPTVLGQVADKFLSAHPVSGLYATGGDVASAVTEQLGAEGFEIESEVLPLAVSGRLVGGRHHGLPFATKGGLIGGGLAAVACIEHLLSAVPRK